MANKIQTIMRTAAMIYAEEQSVSTIKSVKRRFVNAVLVNADNTPQTIENIITILQSDYELVLQEKELQIILDDNRFFEVIVGKTKKENQYYLPNKRFIKLREKSEYSIENAIRDFSSSNSTIDATLLCDLLHRYLYSLLNTNINAYAQLLEKKGEKVSPVIDSNSFDETEIELINNFIRWDNPQKDKALFELVNYCIDYASAINSIDPQDVVSALKNKKLYLDNTLIYRALGINGDFRKQRVLNLLQRCVDSGQQLLISSITRKEFFETIDYHIGHLKETAPYGNINPNLFRQYTGGYSIYQYYHEWRRTKNTYAYELFRIHLKAEYEALLKRFNITEDFKQQYSDEKDAGIIERYADEIMQYKKLKNNNLHINDAKNMVWIELARKDCDHNVRDTKIYFVTSDRKLQEWDLSHSKNQPITMLPSQWLALLLKYYSQSNDDYKTFVSFLTIPNEKGQVSPDELQDILAGISEITEEFQKQDDIVSNLLEHNNNGKYRNREGAKKYAKDIIESEYQEKIKKIEQEYQTKLSEQERASAQLLEKRVEQMLREFQEERKQERIDRIDERIKNCETQMEFKQRLLSQINTICDNKKKWLIGIVITVVVLYVVCVGVLTFFIYDWNIMEPITTYIGMVLLALPFIVSLITNQDFKIGKIPSTYRNWCYKKQCIKYNCNEPEIRDLQETVEALKRQKTELETSKE